MLRKSVVKRSITAYIRSIHSSFFPRSIHSKSAFSGFSCSMLLQTNRRWDLAEISRRQRAGQRQTPCISRFRRGVPGYGYLEKYRYYLERTSWSPPRACVFRFSAWRIDRAVNRANDLISHSMEGCVFFFIFCDQDILLKNTAVRYCQKIFRHIELFYKINP